MRNQRMRSSKRNAPDGAISQPGRIFALSKVQKNSSPLFSTGALCRGHFVGASEKYIVGALPGGFYCFSAVFVVYLGMRKRRVYIETSVWNFLFADDSPRRKKAAKVLVSSSDKYELFISPVVVEEIKRCPGEFGQILIDSLKEYQPVELEPDNEIGYLSGLYVSKGVIPAKYEDDAVHIAYASVYDLDILASYNFKHIVKLKTKTEVEHINRVNGYRTPIIISPEELVDYESD